jgi:hypothetical protein
LSWLLTSWTSSLGRHVGGLDAAVSRRWRAFAAMRVEVPYPQDLGTALPEFLGGIRMVF